LCLAIFIQSSFPSPDQMPHWHNSDKLLHAIAYGILAALFFRAFYFQTNQRWGSVLLFLVSALVSGLYGLSDEWHQSFVPARSADWVDWLADLLGAVIGSGLSLAGLYLYRQIGIRQSIRD
jgi:VanZ family protein